MKHVTLFLCAVVVVLGVHAVTSADAPAELARWEYKKVPSSGESGVDDLNAAGKEGWELVTQVDGWHTLKRRLK